MRDTVKIKPNKPYPTFPLTAHPNGQWCKKVRGKVHFFGIWAEPETALNRYLTLAVDLHSGRQPHNSTVSAEGLTVKETCNAYLNWQKDKMEANEIGERWFEDCRSILKGFAKSLGNNRLVADLRPDDFQQYRNRQAKGLGVHALTREITVVRSVFKYAYESDLIDRPMKFGTGFSAPSAAMKRKAKAQVERQHGKKLFRKEELLSILNSSGPLLKAAVLLGLNGGFGNLDCAKLPISAIDFEVGVIEYSRPKTGVRRIVPLWPETTDALRKILTDERPKPADEKSAKLALLLPTGRPFVRQIVARSKNGGPNRISRLDLLSRQFTELLKELKIHRNGIGFYALRHTFRTWADAAKDQHAVHLIMGHAIPGMSGIYVEEISIDRLRAVADHVRSKLWPSQ